MCSTPFVSRKSTKTWPIVAEVTQKPLPPQVVKQNVLGTVVGQSATDPAGRVTVAFARREDGRSNNLHLGCCGWEPPKNRERSDANVWKMPGNASKKRIELYGTHVFKTKKNSTWGISQFSRRSSMFMAFRHSWNNCSSIMGLFRGAQVWDTKWCLFVQLVWPCLNHQPLSLFCCEQSSNKWEDAK